MRVRLTAVGALAVVSLAALGCDESLSDLAGPTPDLHPTFNSVQAQVFESTDSAGRRACIQCHSSVGRNPSGGLDLTHGAAYANLVGIPARGKPGAVRIVAGDPENSYIVHKIEGRTDIAGGRMPLGGPYLTDGQILVLRRWIELGARND